MSFRRNLLFLAAPLLLLAVPARAQSIIYYDGTSSSPSYGLTALTNLGLTATTVTRGNLAAALNSNIKLVVIEEFSDLLTSGDVTGLVDYINGGGRVIMSYYDLSSSSTLQTAFNVSHAGSFSNPQSVSVWVPSSPAMTGLPTTISALTDDGAWIDNGDRLTVVSGGTALAGYVAEATSGEAAIVAGNSNRTVVNAFISSDFSEANMTKLFENQIKFVGIPEPSTYVLLGLGGGLLWLAQRRRRT